MAQYPCHSISPLKQDDCILQKLQGLLASLPVGGHVPLGGSQLNFLLSNLKFIFTCLGRAHPRECQSSGPHSPNYKNAASVPMPREIAMAYVTAFL